MALRIKDEVDLKELEKFGFKCDEAKFENWNLRLQDTFTGAIEIRITNDRIVYPVADLNFYNLGNRNEFKMHDIMYDLIQAGLIEKVRDRR